MKRKKETVLTVMLGRIGFKRTMGVMNFLGAWAIVESSIGHQPTIEEYCGWWRCSAATGYRDLNKFRNAFPEFKWPSELFAVVVPEGKLGKVDVTQCVWKPS